MRMLSCVYMWTSNSGIGSVPKMEGNTTLQVLMNVYNVIEALAFETETEMAFSGRMRSIPLYTCRNNNESSRANL
jgi:hypothetical protein